ncbi:hypothetical protein A0H81_02809 [Grifola frondosa]|uniref:Uncharacterized protein n=1 Tax=Grifola frondosa TaxID=5627 RepID=A0A1C7MNL8_GRIFR|nr:hypothetical protein A0H81_02809 [Grifola frondosa]
MGWLFALSPPPTAGPSINAGEEAAMPRSDSPAQDPLEPPIFIPDPVDRARWQSLRSMGLHLRGTLTGLLSAQAERQAELDLIIGRAGGYPEGYVDAYRLEADYSSDLECTSLLAENMQLRSEVWRQRFEVGCAQAEAQRNSGQVSSLHHTHGGLRLERGVGTRDEKPEEQEPMDKKGKGQGKGKERKRDQ